MARGRHRRRSGLLSWLLPRRRRTRVEVLEADMARLRSLAEASAATASAALVRASAAGESALLAQQRSLLAAAELSATREEVVALRAELAALREELVWAFAARKADVEGPATVIDLREGSASTA